MYSLSKWFATTSSIWGNGVQIAVSSPSPELEEQVDLHNAVSAQKFHIQPELVFEYDDIAAFGKVATAFFDTYQSMLSDMTPKIQA